MRFCIGIKSGPDRSLPAADAPALRHKTAGGKELPTPLSGNRCAKTFIGQLRYAIAIC